MSDKMGDKIFNKSSFKKDFLQNAVRELSRLLVGRTNGQEQIWKKNPPHNWPAHLKWKNPTSSPKDQLSELEEKFNFLKQEVSYNSIPEDQKTILRLYEEGKLTQLSYCQDVFKIIANLKNLKPPAVTCQDTNEIEKRLLSEMEGFKTKLIKCNENKNASTKYLPILPKCSLESVLLKVNQSDDSIISYHNAETSLQANNASLYFNHKEKNNPQNSNILVPVHNLHSSDLKNYNSGTGTKRKDETAVSESAHQNSKPKKRRVEDNNNDLKIDNTQTSTRDFNILLSPSTSVTNDGHSPAILNFQDVSNAPTPSTQRSNDSGHESEDSLDQDYSQEDLNISSNSSEFINMTEAELENFIDVENIFRFSVEMAKSNVCDN